MVLWQVITRVQGEVGCSFSFYEVSVSFLVGLPGFGEGLWGSVNLLLHISFCLFLCLSGAVIHHLESLALVQVFLHAVNFSN